MNNNGFALEGFDPITRVGALSSEGGIIYDIFDFLRPVGYILDGLMNILAAVMHVQV